MRLKAITEMMDRGGVTATTEISLGGNVRVERSAADEVRERLAEMAARHAAPAASAAQEPVGENPPDEAVDAEVVDG